MLIYSRDDETVPFEFGRELYEAANEPKELVEIFGSHNDGFLTSGEIYKNAWTKWLKFLKGYKKQPALLNGSDEGPALLNGSDEGPALLNGSDEGPALLNGSDEGPAPRCIL